MKDSAFIGREDEIRILKRCLEAKEAQLVILYGRRRVGKTFLVNETFNNEFAFKFTGTYKRSRLEQLSNFTEVLNEAFNKDYATFKTWTEAFFGLRAYLESLPKNKKSIVFFDEMPWLDTPKSSFLSSFEFFWNNYGNSNNNLIFIVAGSSSSWISNKLFKNKGGFYNRHTARIYLEPFTLKETKEYLISRNIHYDNYDIAQLYMIMGGIPFYLSQLSSAYSLNQNIDYIFFKKRGPLWDEFKRLYETLFNNDPKYIDTVELLSKHRYGLTRNEISKEMNITNSGNLTTVLENLIESGFVNETISYSPRKERIYQLEDYYTLFYFHFIKEHRNDENFFSSSTDLPKRRNYFGLCFELLAKQHISEIKHALGISGVSASVYSLNIKGNNEKRGCQIDLVIDRRDKMCDLLEIKFSLNDFVIDKNYYDNLRNKFATYIDNNPRKSVRIVLLSTYPLKKNQYSNIINASLTLNDLFDE